MGSGAGANELSYDLFLSYNSVDYRIVEEVAHKLAAAGFKEISLTGGMCLKAHDGARCLKRPSSSAKLWQSFWTWRNGLLAAKEVDIALDLQ